MEKGRSEGENIECIISQSVHSTHSDINGVDDCSSSSADGRSCIEKIIDWLPIEIHFPNYNYAGVGTHLTERLERNVTGINQFDEYCKFHDIAYAENKNKNRREADKLLVQQALSRVTADDAEMGEKCVALISYCLLNSKLAVEKFFTSIRKLFMLLLLCSRKKN